LAAALAAGYTAFLFGQAEGRDLWQSRWLLPHLLAQAGMTGAGALAIAVVLADSGADAIALVARALAVAAMLHLAITGLDLGGRHESRRAAVAARTLVQGRYRTAFWWGAVTPAAVAAVLAALAWNGDGAWALLLAGLVVQGALLTYETIYVRAGQDVPLS
jgi:Ni/Fe-hydrogenase subunit HybB-like protein